MTTGAITFQQLGGNRFVAMTGARSLTQDETTFTFRLPNNFANHGINHVRIVLEASDTYYMRFGKLRGDKFSVIEECDGVYADGLRRTFTAVTGLDVSL